MSGVDMSTPKPSRGRETHAASLLVARATGAMEQTILVLMALRVAAVALGLVFLRGAWRSYRRYRTRPMMWLVTAVALLVAAVLAEGFVVRVLGWPLEQAHVAEAVVSFLGFVALVLSVQAIWVRHRRPGPELS